MRDTSTGQSIPARVRAEMAIQRKGQGDLARVLGLSQAAVSRRLHGHVAFDVDELVRVAEFLGKNAADFLPAAVA